MRLDGRRRLHSEETTSPFERSQVESDLGKDLIGAAIARTLRAVIAFEEGARIEPAATLRKELDEFIRLSDDPAVIRAGRDGFARRWILNTRVHLVQAHLADGDAASARKLFDIHQLQEAIGPSPAGRAMLQRVEARICLMEGTLDAALSAIGKSWDAIDIEQAGLAEVDLAAATVAIAGVVHALQGEAERAMHCFHVARTLPADLHNHTAQGLACAGDAILKAESGDRHTALGAVSAGLQSVQRCGAPVRHFLLELLHHYEERHVLDTKRRLQKLQLLAAGAG